MSFGHSSLCHFTLSPMLLAGLSQFLFSKSEGLLNGKGLPATHSVLPCVGAGEMLHLHLLWMPLACKTLSLILPLFASFLSHCTTHGGLFCVRHHPCLLTNLYFLNRFNFSSINSQNCSEFSVFPFFFFKKKRRKKETLLGSGRW